MPAIGPYAYPFDPSGAEVSNKVLNEIQVVTAVNSNEYHIVVPNFAPFFRASLIVLNGGTMTPLVEGTDFIFTHKYKEATINTAIPIYGSITLLNKNFSGVLIFQEYQTVGGQWTLTTTQINQILADKMLNPRITTWEQLGVAPEHFPVIDHMHVDPEELIGMPELVQAIEDVGVAVSGIVIDYDAINAYADSKVQDSMTPSQTTKAPSVRAVQEALDGKADISQIPTLQDSITDGVVDQAPTVNAVYDALTDVYTAIGTKADASALASKANDNAVVHLTGNESIDDVKTFTATPQLPDVGTDTTNDSNNAASTKFVQNVFDKVLHLPKFHVRDELADGTGRDSGGAGNTWRGRPCAVIIQNDLTTANGYPINAVNAGGSGEYTLPNGKYRLRGWATFRGLEDFRLRLLHSLGTTLVLGGNTSSDVNDGGVGFISGDFLLNGGSGGVTVTIENWYSSRDGGTDNNRYGKPSNSGELEVYSEFIFEYLGP